MVWSGTVPLFLYGMPFGINSNIRCNESNESHLCVLIYHSKICSMWYTFLFPFRQKYLHDGTNNELYLLVVVSESYLLVRLITRFVRCQSIKYLDALLVSLVVRLVWNETYSHGNIHYMHRQLVKWSVSHKMIRDNSWRVVIRKWHHIYRMNMLHYM